jgi:hypothetical protein
MATLYRKALDRELTEKHRSYWEAHQATARGKYVVLVEGDDDRDVLEQALALYSGTWANRTHVAAAGSRKNVLAKLSEEQRWATFGLVDRDAWTKEESEDKVAAAKNASATLFVTSGWCLENIFLDPAWLTAVYPDIAQSLEAQRAEWVRAGALWWTIQRAREAQQVWHSELGGKYGLPHQELDTSSSQTLLQGLKSKVPPAMEHAARINLETIAQQFEQRCADVFAMSVQDQWRVGVHGKAAFNQLLVPALQKRFPSQQDINWRLELAKLLPKPLPSPLEQLKALLPP